MRMRKKRTGGGKPPRDTRFPKGTSGNPKGRPKGARGIKTLLMEAARNKISIAIDGTPRRITTAQASTLQLAFKAAGGDQKAIGAFLDRLLEIENEAAAAKPAQFPLGAADLEVLRAAYERIQQCEHEDAGGKSAQGDRGNSEQDQSGANPEHDQPQIEE